MNDSSCNTPWSESYTDFYDYIVLIIWHSEWVLRPVQRNPCTVLLNSGQWTDQCSTRKGKTTSEPTSRIPLFLSFFLVTSEEIRVP